MEAAVASRTATAAPAKTVPDGTSYWVAADALAIKRSGNSTQVGNPSAACARGKRVSGGTWRMRAEDQPGNATCEKCLPQVTGPTMTVRFANRGAFMFYRTTRSKPAKKGKRIGSGDVSDCFYGC